jgi:E3 ubiquitin-protein ligase MGRN1
MGNVNSQADVHVAQRFGDGPGNDAPEARVLGPRPVPAVETSPGNLVPQPGAVDGLPLTGTVSWQRPGGDVNQGSSSGLRWLQGGAERSTQPVPTMVHAYTIKNDLNVRKKSVRLVRDPENPQQFLLEFVFDATCSGLCTVFFMAKDLTNRTTRVEQFHVEPLEPVPPVPTPFEAGMGQRYRQNSHRGFVPSRYRESFLFEQNPAKLAKHRYPIVILLQRLESAEDLAKSGHRQVQQSAGRSTDTDPNEGSLVRFQATYVTLCMPPKGLELADEIPVKVVQQKILVDGTIYELQEIYGIEERMASADDSDAAAAEAEHDDLCIICMTDPRDTTVLPCRHLCLCVDCAQLLRVRSDRCPICRSPVDSLLHIRNLRANAR